MGWRMGWLSSGREGVACEGLGVWRVTGELHCSGFTETRCLPYRPVYRTHTTHTGYSTTTLPDHIPAPATGYLHGATHYTGGLGLTTTTSYREVGDLGRGWEEA